MEWKGNQYIQQKARKNKTVSTVTISKPSVNGKTNGSGNCSKEMAVSLRPHTTGGAVNISRSRYRNDRHKDNDHDGRYTVAKQKQPQKVFDFRRRELRINNYISNAGTNTENGAIEMDARSGIKRPLAARTKINKTGDERQTHVRCLTTLPIITHDSPSPRTPTKASTPRDISLSISPRINTQRSQTLDIHGKLSGSRQSISQGSDLGSISRRGSVSSLTSSRSAPEYLYGATQWDMFSESLKHLNDDSNLYMKKPKVLFNSSTDFKNALISWKKHNANSRRGKGWRSIAKGGKSWAALSVQFKKNEVQENSDTESEHESSSAKTTESQRRWAMIRRNIQDIQLERRANKAVFNWDMLRQHLMNLSDMEKGRRDLYERYLVLKDPMANSKTPKRDLKSALKRVKSWNEKETELLRDNGNFIDGTEKHSTYNRSRHSRSFSK